MTKVHSPSAYLLLITRPVNYWRSAGRSSKGRFAVQTVATMRWRLLLVKGGPLVRIDPDTTPVSWTILSTEPHQSCTRYRSTYAVFSPHSTSRRRGWVRFNIEENYVIGSRYASRAPSNRGNWSCMQIKCHYPVAKLWTWVYGWSNRGKREGSNHHPLELRFSSKATIRRENCCELHPGGWWEVLG